MMPENISGVDNSQKCTKGVFILLPNSSASLYDNCSSSDARKSNLYFTDKGKEVSSIKQKTYPRPFSELKAYNELNIHDKKRAKIGFKSLDLLYLKIMAT